VGRAAGLDGFLAGAAGKGVFARENARAGVAAEEHEALGEHGESGDRGRTAGCHGGVCDHAVVERGVERVIAGVVGHGLHMDADMEQLHKAGLGAHGMVERTLGIDG